MKLPSRLKYDKQDQQGQAAFNERKTTRTSGKEDRKQKQDRAQGRARTGYSLKSKGSYDARATSKF
jgi:hypothetical protein